jgi:hypothetical protein
MPQQRIPIRNVLITQFDQAKAVCEIAEEALAVEFGGFRELMNNYEFEQAREYLREMPQCATKVLFFREIIITEDETFLPGIVG